ncbi:MAG: GntR family transcriptional regulator [Eubacterium sp.]|nr:GntR family transcriptional regulator [Eubacterium sp.]
MLIFINNKNGVPIYEQIYAQIKAQIISDELGEDAPLPSIRNLAKDLHISVITTKRAYEELEKDGFIYTSPGKGCFVAAKNTELLQEENLRKIESHLEEIIKLSSSCKLNKNDIISMLDILFEEEQ